ncbi:alpha/beta fold hydrolase [Burkholderia sp. Ac-20353]|uniref:alpha/beta fold hydrolase n=1 Tax=Burkholderia sp. Ac-20353 TaxID=2703894 RepID=UPI00197B4AB3|nr:alpha/beta fold hydrolase [Burkholderia sp. Ac-20353]MBN3786257.1 alpha/beta fold hydrolase [Burkholderia sp. Ac-20353]
METNLTAASPASPQSAHPVFVLVHGAWQGAWCYAHVAAALAARGHLSIARDLPAHGINARFPASYFKRPLDKEAFGAEPSPVANTTLDDYASQVMQAVDDAYALGHGKVVLVGHSMGGLAITAAAERMPEKIAKIVYLAAFMPASGVPGLDYVRAPENQGEMLGHLMLASPRTAGALRIDPRSDDAAYQATAKQALFDDVSQAEYEAVANLMSCDVPAAPFATAIPTTAARWGAIDRHYIKCLQDRVILPALQQRFIDEADAFAPDNPTHVHQLDSSHSPYISQPAVLAGVLADIAKS